MKDSLDLNILEELGFVKGLTGDPHAIKYEYREYSIYIVDSYWYIGVHKGENLFKGKIYTKEELLVILSCTGVLN